MQNHFALACYLIALVALSQPLKARPIGDVTITMTSQIVSDGISLANAKSLPLAVVEYKAIIANRSLVPLAPNSLVVTNPIPSGLVLYVGDIVELGSGPVLFAEGSLPSQLTCIFGDITDGSDCIEFSNDGGGTFSYQPQPDEAGFDAAITHVRIRPQGVMAPALIQPSSFILRYRMKVT